MSNNIFPPTPVLEALYDFSKNVEVLKYEIFVGLNDVLICSIEGDQYSPTYAAYLAQLLPSSPKSLATISRDYDNGGLRKRQVSCKKVMIFAHEPDKKVESFVGGIFRNFFSKEYLTPEDVLYITAVPYKLRKIGELSESNSSS